LFKTMRVGDHCIIVMLRLFESKIESYSRGVPRVAIMHGSTETYAAQHASNPYLSACG